MTDRDTITCDRCGIEMWDTDDGRTEMALHTTECRGSDDPRERFEVGDRVEYSAFGKHRLNRDDREGEVVGFSEEPHLVRVRWDGNTTAGRYAHSFIKPTFEQRIHDVSVMRE